MQGQTRRRSLLVLLGALMMTAAWGYLRPNLVRDRKGNDFVPVIRRSAATSRTVPLTPLHLASLDEVRPVVVAGRNPWRFVDPPPRRTVTETAVTSGSPSGTSQLAEPSAQPVASPAEVPLEYLGHFGPPEKKIAVFSDGKQVRNALEGDVLDGRFRVAHIGYESVEIELLGYPGGPATRLSVRRR